MADQPQTPQVGVVGQQGAQPGAAAQAAAPAPSPGVPGVQAPPRPSPEQIAKIVAEQQRVMAQQVKQSQKQAGYSGENAPPAAPTNNRFSQQSAQQPAAQQTAPAPAPAQSNQAVGQIPANIAAQMPPQMTQQDQPAPQSPIPGLSAEQVLAGPPQPQSAPQPVYQQPQPPPQPVYQNQPPSPQQFAPQQAYQPAQQQFAPQQAYQPAQQQLAPQAAQARPSGIAAYAQTQAVDKPKVPWFPVRGAKGSVDIELSDVIIKNVPSDFPTGEANAGAKVVLALFSEILALRDQVQFLMDNQQSPQGQMPQDLPNRVYHLERTLFEQKQALSSRARGVQDQIAMGQAKGFTPEQILATLQGQSVAAAQMVQSGVQPAATHTTTEQQPAAQASQVAAAGQAAPAEEPASE